MIKLTISPHTIPHQQFSTCILILATNSEKLNKFLSLFNPDSMKRTIGKIGKNSPYVFFESYAFFEHYFVQDLYNLCTQKLDLSEFDDKDITMQKKIENFLIQYIPELNRQFDRLAQENIKLQNQITTLTATPATQPISQTVPKQVMHPIKPHYMMSQIQQQPTTTTSTYPHQTQIIQKILPQQQTPQQSISTLQQNFFYPPGTENDPNIPDEVWSNSNVQNPDQKEYDEENISDEDNFDDEDNKRIAWNCGK